jgi:hypothetical protein
MKTFKAALLAIVCALGWTSLAPAAERPRQFYTTKMVYDREGDYSRGAYYFKVKPSDANYKFHYVIRLKSDPQHLYFYNPATKKFWGRFDALKQKYSLLAEEDRVSRLTDLSSARFPEPGPMPPIPGSTDGVAMDIPPGEFTPAPEMPPTRRVEVRPDNGSPRPPAVGSGTLPPAPSAPPPPATGSVAPMPPATDSGDQPTTPTTETGAVPPPVVETGSQPPQVGTSTPPPQTGATPPLAPSNGSDTKRDKPAEQTPIQKPTQQTQQQSPVQQSPVQQSPVQQSPVQQAPVKQKPSRGK